MKNSKRMNEAKSQVEAKQYEIDEALELLPVKSDCKADIEEFFVQRLIIEGVERSGIVG